jgi:uncharacterized protein involved in outer membrane biogenesis
VVKADKPTLRATLTSKLIDLAELQAEAGGAPSYAAAGNEAKPEAKPETKPGSQAGGDGRLFSDAPLPVAGLKAANADVKLSAAKVTTTGPALNNVTVALALNNGKLTIKPFQADVVGGRIDSDTVLDASQAQPVLSVNAKAKGLDLAELVKEMKVSQKITGKADFEAVASGAGASVRAIMAGLNGQTSLSIGEMRVDNTLMKIVMADLARPSPGAATPRRLTAS